MQAPVLITESLSKVIGGRKIVDSVSLEIGPGEIFGFLGPNGAGKTTTIRMLVGLIRPSSGSVRICGHDIQRDFTEAIRNVGCIVETPDLYRFMTGRENLEHFARMVGDVRSEEIERVATVVAMAHRLDDKVRTYSLGMRQRLGIAQALLGSPRLLILDEPANGLDPAGIREIRNLLRSLTKSGISILISSHLLAEIEMLCDRVAIIHRGRILHVGSVREMLTQAQATEFRTSDLDATERIATENGLTARRNGTSVLVTGADEETALLTSKLVAEGISVYHARPRVPTLEELFLEATGGETVGD